ncbi:MAG: hypothetical protein A2902_04265 [Elusimicrobia bacterium RIFCSPLOWO2_01_FULL_64_13]|nr:MAG: hypothetical protein A2902_04265 [Elusimicrobia bacterium RIFCSPLOWO2_01_FULL_64_13]
MTRRDGWALWVILALPCLYLSGALLTGKTFFMRDLTYLFHPWRSLSSQMLQAGDFPLWNPYEMGGMPFLANCQSAILYPWTALFGFFGFVPGLKMFHLAHYALAGIGFYLLGIRLGLRGTAAFAGCLIAAYNGYALSRHEFVSALGSWAWFPWVLLFSHSPGESLRAPCLGLGIALSLSLLGGFPQIFLLSAAAGIAFSFLTARPGKAAALWAGAGLLFLGLTAAQWIPTAELIGRSIRGGQGLPYEEAVRYSFPPENLAGLAVPKFLAGHPDRYTGEKFFWIWSGWWGAAATMAALRAFFILRKRREASFAFVLALAGLLWSLGGNLEWFRALYDRLFFLKWFRYPPAALLWTAGGAGLLASFGISAMAGSSARWIRLAAPVLTFAIAGELFAYSRGIAPTTHPDYFHAAPRLVRSVMAGRPGMAILSPKLEAGRRLSGRTEEEARAGFRGLLFDLTNLPYRVPTLNPSGEPLALLSYAERRGILARDGSLAAARRRLNAWNVTHLITTDDPGPGWTLLDRSGPVNLYRNPEAFGWAAAFPEGPAGTASPTLPESVSFDRGVVRAVFDMPAPARAVFAVPFYPGWKIRCAKCKMLSHRRPEMFQTDDFLCSTLLPPGRHDLVLFYQPGLWLLALMITLTATSSAAAAGFLLARP